MEKHYPNNQHHEPKYKAFYESHFWWHGGGEWSSIIKDEIYQQTKQPAKDNKSIKNGPLLFGLAGLLTVLGSTIWIRVGELSQRVNQAAIPTTQHLDSNQIKFK
jgi:hypothetical protein